MSSKKSDDVTRFDPGSDCTLRHAGSMAASLAETIGSGRSLEIDCAGIEQADITFVQIVVSAQRSCVARGLPFTLARLTDDARSAFQRAGVTPPGVSPSELSGN